MESLPELPLTQSTSFSPRRHRPRGSKSGSESQESWWNKASNSVSSEDKIIEFLEFPNNSHWVPDDWRSNCVGCDLPFTLIRRRHHCRRCKDIFCGSCRPKKLCKTCTILTEGSPSFKSQTVSPSPSIPSTDSIAVEDESLSTGSESSIVRALAEDFDNNFSSRSTDRYTYTRNLEEEARAWRISEIKRISTEEEIQERRKNGRLSNWLFEGERIRRLNEIQESQDLEKRTREKNIQLVIEQMENERAKRLLRNGLNNDEVGRWIPNHDQKFCKRCEKPFNVIWRRRHHCRKCGQIFCQDCASERAQVSYIYSRRVRVCKGCAGWLQCRRSLIKIPWMPGYDHVQLLDK